MSGVKIFTAKRVFTMAEESATFNAVAVKGHFILKVGTLQDLQNQYKDAQIDSSFEQAYMLPGLIDQHLHPLLGALCLADGIIATEDWNLPGGTIAAATSPAEYQARIKSLVDTTETEYVISWGYHQLWHGPLSRQVLDSYSSAKPIIVWHRSCHEFYLNSATLAKLGVTEESIKGYGVASTQVDFAKGHFYEAGTNLIADKLIPIMGNPVRMIKGLKQMAAYLHANGVTAINEPGAILTPDTWKLYQMVLENPTVPFYTSFFPDARGFGDKYGAEKMMPHIVEQAALAPEQMPGKRIHFFKDTIKLFADGAIISQMMQMKDGYLDGHHGEWMIEPAELKKRWDIMWDASYQIHCHVNGDAGLQVVLDILEDCMKRNPRPDHRTVIVHFANSTEEQVLRIKKLGAIISANPYYPVGFAEKFSKSGLGPERAHVMVRAKSALDAGIPLSFHSDLPMGPSSPLMLASFAVNRTVNGIVYGPEQRINVMDALKAVTIQAAYSWRKEDKIGSIEPGKIANFTFLAQDPFLNPEKLGDIPVLATIFEGIKFPVAGMEIQVEHPSGPSGVSLKPCC
jgi:predicted amidohydrolase YtcJ